MLEQGGKVDTFFNETFTRMTHIRFSKDNKIQPKFCTFKIYTNLNSKKVLNVEKKFDMSTKVK